MLNIFPTFSISLSGIFSLSLTATSSSLLTCPSTLLSFADKIIRDNAKFIIKKNIYILNKFFFNQPEEVVFRSISIVLNKISNKYYSARGKSIIDLIHKIKSNMYNKFTLNNCYIEKIKETVIITKENHIKN